MSATAHEQQVAALQAKIKAADTAIGSEKLRQAQEIVKAHRRWDLKNAITPSVYTLLIGGKAAYDVYTFQYTRNTCMV